MAKVFAVDGGGSRTRGGLYDSDRTLLAEVEGGPSNPVDIGAFACVQVLSALAQEATQGYEGPIETIVASLSGVGKWTDCDGLARSLLAAIPAQRVVLTNDLVPMLETNLGHGGGILVVAGTGSCVIARDDEGNACQFGGRGPLFSDDGSAHSVAVVALRCAAHAQEGRGPETGLQEALHEAVGLSSFDELSQWAATAPKEAIAELAVVVTTLARDGDDVAAQCVQREAELLAEMVADAAKQLALTHNFQVLTHGSLLTESRVYADAFGHKVRVAFPSAIVQLPKYTGHEAAFRYSLSTTTPHFSTVAKDGSAAAESIAAITEGRLSTSSSIDTLTARQISVVMCREDRVAAEAVRALSSEIGSLIEACAAAIRCDGRIIYVGAGTSGRLGVLDASEIPPTFGVPSDRVIGIMAGGERAIRQSVEGAEDDQDQAVRDLCAVTPPVTSEDVVIGISASGTTPYVLSALAQAKGASATTALVCCNPVDDEAFDHVIALATGPEVVAGSTRLKAGTATKLVLNQISTGAMALAGYVYDGYMVGVVPANVKLRKRAAKILSEITGLSLEESTELLDAADGRIPVAALKALGQLSKEDAESKLATAGGSLRDALDAL